jgi:hypothetical protein
MQAYFVEGAETVEQNELHQPESTGTVRDGTAGNRGKRGHLIIIGVILGAFAGLGAGIVALSEQEYVWSRLLLVGVFFLLAASSLAEKAREARFREQPWRELAQHTGLTYQTGNFWLGRPERVIGTYRNYRLTLYTSRLGGGHAPRTRIELALNAPVDGIVRLRGPYERAEVASETAFNQVYGSGNLYHIGYERFLIRSQPRSLAFNLFGTDGRRHGPLRYRLLQLKQITNIELDGQRLHAEQFGTLVDSAYAQTLFDLLTDIAAGLEEATAEARAAQAEADLPQSLEGHQTGASV